MTTALIFEQLEATVHRLKQQANEDILVVSCEPTIAMKWLIPRLPAFQLAHPDIQLHLNAAGGPIDFAKAGVDVPCVETISVGRRRYTQHEFVTNGWGLSLHRGINLPRRISTARDFCIPLPVRHPGTRGYG